MTDADPADDRAADAPNRAADATAPQPADGTRSAPDDGPDLVDVDVAIAEVEQLLGALFSRVRAGWREAAATVHPELQPLGYQVLTSIVSGRATSAGAVVELLQTDKSAVSRQMRFLEELGLVESRPDPADGRARILIATPLAHERVRLARAGYEGRLAERLRGWTEADLAHFARLLGRLAR